jgi:hypothetical protein
VEDAEAYLSLDIDRYTEETTFANDKYSFQAEVAATSHNKRKGLYRNEESRRQLTIESQPQQVDYLWFLVGGEERLSQANEQRIYQQWLNSRPGIAKAQQSADTEYWWITKIRLDKKKDSSGDEFELYYGPDGYDGSAHPFNYYALLLFNGTYQNDVSGISRYCPDINGTGTYTMPHPIAIEVLTPDSPAGFKICPIEDDCYTAYHANGGQGTYAFYMHAYDIDAFNWFGRTYYFTIIDNCADDDDIYNNSGTISFGASSYECAYSYPSAPHVRLCLRRGTVSQADNNWGGQACSSGGCGL